MTSKQFKQVDVFTKTKYQGNPVAVFFDSDNLTTEEMHKMANWTNLSETTFASMKPTNPKADYKLRIFTPAVELPFAGHPTVGSCHALLEAGLIKPNAEGKVYQECQAGLVEITVDSTTGEISFKLPDAIHYEFTYTEEILKNLGLSQDQVLRVVLVDDGPKWLTLELKSAEDVLAVSPNFTDLAQSSSDCDIVGVDIFGKYPGEENLYEARNFAPNDGVNEDPVCGSGAGAIGSILAYQDDFTGVVIIKQGRKLGRDGELKVTIGKDPEGSKEVTRGYDIKVGGYAVTCINGTY